MYIGVDVGGSHIGFGLLNDKFEITDSKIKLTNPNMNSKDIIKLLIEGIDEIISQEVKYIGIGFPGKCDLVKGTVTLTKYSEFWNIDVVGELKKVYSIPIYFENDANCAAVAEKYKGKLQNTNNGVLLAIGTGIGLGIIINNQLYRGSNFFGGEIGHSFFKNNEKNWKCEGNTYQNYLSLKFLKENITTFEVKRNDIKQIFLIDNDETKKIREFWIGNLAYCLITISYIIDPEKIVLGGGIADIFEYIYEDLIVKVKKEIPYAVIEKATFDNDAGIIGAALIGKENM